MKKLKLNKRIILYFDKIYSMNDIITNCFERIRGEKAFLKMYIRAIVYTYLPL